MQKTFSRLGSRLGLRLGLMLLTLAAPAALMADTIYSVNQSLPVGGVTGTITTNGATGVLTTANILDWTLTLNDGFNVTTLTSGNSSFDTGLHDTVGLNNVDLTATATNLFFNYNSGDGGFMSFGGAGGELCYTGWSNCFGPHAVGLWNVNGDSRYDFVAQGGNQVIATAETPEPGSLVLLGSGLLGLSGAMRRKFAK